MSKFTIVNFKNIINHFRFEELSRDLGTKQQKRIPYESDLTDNIIPVLQDICTIYNGGYMKFSVDFLVCVTI